MEVWGRKYVTTISTRKFDLNKEWKKTLSSFVFVASQQQQSLRLRLKHIYEFIMAQKKYLQDKQIRTTKKRA